MANIFSTIVNQIKAIPELINVKKKEAESKQIGQEIAQRTSAITPITERNLAPSTTTAASSVPVASNLNKEYSSIFDNYEQGAANTVSTLLRAPVQAAGLISGGSNVFDAIKKVASSQYSPASINSQNTIFQENLNIRKEQEDQKKSLIASGLSPQEAERKVALSLSPTEKARTRRFIEEQVIGATEPLKNIRELSATKALVKQGAKITEEQGAKQMATKTALKKVDDALHSAIEDVQTKKPYTDLRGKVDFGLDEEVKPIFNKLTQNKTITQDERLSAFEYLARKGYKSSIGQQEVFGAVAGVDIDEDGTVHFNPEKAALGVIGIGAIKKIAPELAQKPGVIMEETSPVSKLVTALKELAPIRESQEALYTAERSRRIAQVSKLQEQAGGQAGFYQELSKLKGELPKVQYESIVKKYFSQEDVDSLFNQIKATDKLSSFEKISAQGGLLKLLGEQGVTPPTRGEIELLRQVFPEELIKNIENITPLKSKLLATLGEILNLPRAIMASVDLSAPLRQGAFLIGNPKQFLPAFKDMFKFAASEKAYAGLIENIKARPNYELMRESGLALTDIGSVTLSGREEKFMSNLAEKIPAFGPIARASNRAYTGFLNKLRADVFDDLLGKATRLGIKTPPVDSISKFVNAATGRGDLGALNRAAPVLNSVFFSPRLMASRFNLLNPLFYTKLDPFVRKEALKSLLLFGSVAGTAIGLAKLGGADVETDPRNADFGKLKFGDTRYDVLAGFQQYIRLASQLISGKVISSTTGKEITLGEGYKPLTRFDVGLRFFESKEAPVMSFITELAKGQTATGQDINIPAEIMSRFIPMAASDLYDLYQEGGLKGVIDWLPAPFGVGVQTYGKQELVSGENTIGQNIMQVRPVQGLTEALSEKAFGQQPLSSTKTYNIQAYLKQLDEMPKDEAANIFDQIAKNDPDLAKKISKIVEEEKAGITQHDRDLKDKGVSDGTRARAVKKELDKLNSNIEKADLWDEYVKKGIITKDVAEQITILNQREAK